MLRRLKIALVAACMSCGLGMAAEVTRVISGEVTAFADGSGAPDIVGLAVGVPFVGSFTYDTGMPPTVGSPPFSQTYEQAPPIAPLGLTFTVLGHTFSAGDGAALKLTIEDAATDVFHLESADVAELAGLVENLYLDLSDPGGSAFGGLAIPGSLDLAAFADATLSLQVDPGDPVGSLELSLRIDGMTPPYSPPQIYWVDTATQTVSRAELDGSNPVNLVLASNPTGIVLDEEAGHIFWTAASVDGVSRADLDGSNVQVLATGLGFPYGVGVAPSAGIVAFADLAFPSKVYSVPVNGGLPTELVDQTIGTAYGLAVDDANGKMYWTVFGSPSLIRRANLNGSLVENLLVDLGNSQGIALDVPAGKMYWTDLGTDEIFRSNLNGSGAELLVDSISGGLANPIGIHVHRAAGKIYWTDTTTDKIQRANLDGSSVETVLTSAAGLSFPRDVFVTEGNGCDAPDLPVDLEVIALPAGPLGPVAMTLTDPNSPGEVTGYNVYRSADASSPKGAWPLIGLNVTDLDGVTPGVQWEDASGDVSPSGIWFYNIAAYNSGCPAEGPD